MVATKKLLRRLLGIRTQGEEFLLRQGFGEVDVWRNVAYLVAFSWGNRLMSYLVRRLLSDARFTCRLLPNNEHGDVDC